MSNWNWIEEPPARFHSCVQAWSIADDSDGGGDYDFPSVVLPVNRKQWRIVPPNKNWQEFTSDKFKTKEAAMVAAKILHSAGVWK